MNIYEDDVTEVINDDEEDGDSETPHPLMLPRKKKQSLNRPRPISAKTTVT